MAKLIFEERIGRQGAIRLGCSAVIFSPEGDRILLTRRSDNGQWCLPGGGMDPGESAAETCAREVFEETGLLVDVGRLIGVYSDPHMLVEYADGNRFHLVALSFEATVTGGSLIISDETTDAGYYTVDEIVDMDLLPHHHERIADALAGRDAAFVR
jgi:8-oxo-dGTP pyrophosphatase MutT (NUDIX family)